VTERLLQMVGNAHIDPVWLWQWPEGLAEVRATFRSALDRMTEYPEFIFTAGSAAYYEWVERTDPAMFDEIRRRVDEGRWELVGGWWVEPDCNLPGGESLVRQALLGQRYFESRFGRTAETGYNVDSFGHTAALPQLLLNAGLRNYVFMRPQPHEMDLPGEVFWWESADGSRVLAARLPHEYCGPRGALHDYLDTALAKLGHGWRDAMLFYGVGNHGGGPTRENIDSLLAIDAEVRAARRPDGGAAGHAGGNIATRVAADVTAAVAAEVAARPRLELSSPNRFFATIRRRLAAGELTLPVWRGDLQHHARGCYAAHSGVKRWDRLAERALLTAEAMTALEPGPEAAALESAWRNVAFNEFHDILAGTAIEPAYDDARDTYGEAMAIAGRATAAAIQRIARRIDLPLDPLAKPIVVVNLHAWAVTAAVELETGGVRDDDVLLDDLDRPIPWQRIQSDATASDWRRRVLFPAELPPLGYAVFRMVTAARAAELARDPSLPAGSLTAAPTTLENDALRVDVDPATGWISALIDKASGIDVAGIGLARALVSEDRSDTWSHDLVGFDPPIGAFVPASVELVEAGPVRATIRVDARFRASRLVLDISLLAGADQVELAGRLDWREPRHVLKLRFGAGLEDGEAIVTAGLPFGAIVRPAAGAEEPGGQWLDVSGPLVARGASDRAAAPGASAAVGGARAGLLVLTGTKSGYDASGGDVGVTVVRSPIYAHHDPRVADEARELFSYQDIGLQRFRMALRPHQGSWPALEPVRRAAELAAPPITSLESFHAGDLSQALSFGEVRGAGLVVTAIKRAEDGDATIVRLAETVGGAGRGSIRLGERRCDVELGPWEIRTLRFPDDPAEGVREVDLLERSA
jgi:alpha-mannosidase